MGSEELLTYMMIRSVVASYGRFLSRKKTFKNDFTDIMLNIMCRVDYRRKMPG